MQTNKLSVERALNHHSMLTLSDSPRLDCQMLLAHILDKPRTWLLIHEDYCLGENETADFFSLIEQRIAGKPMAYIIGAQEFWSRPFLVTEATLIPRPDTELLVETILERYPLKQAKVIDLGTGAGPIAIALACERPEFKIFASDFSLEALKIAKNNSLQLSGNHVQFVQCDWLATFGPEQFDIIVSNPPYIDANDPHLPALSFEPCTALIAKDKGLAAFRKIISTAKDKLKAGGMILLEHGYQQQSLIENMLSEYRYTDIEPLTDLSGQPRAVLAYKSAYKGDVQGVTTRTAKHE